MRPRGPRQVRNAAVLLAATVAVMHLGPAAVAQVTLPGSMPALDGQDSTATLPNRLQGRTSVQEMLGEPITTDLPFLNENGETVTVGSLLGEGKPLVVAFVYHSCPMLCSLVLDGLAGNIAGLEGLSPGTDYEVLAVSFDPRDTPEVAAEVKAKYLDQIGRPGIADGVHLWTVTGETELSVETLADDLGFGYAYDPRSGEYGHSAATMFVSPDGIVTRYLYGLEHDPRDFRLAVVESSQGTVGSTLDKFLLTCFAYDADDGSYSLAILGVLKVGSVLLIVLFGGLLVQLWRRASLGSKTPDDVFGPPTVSTT